MRLEQNAKPAANPNPNPKKTNKYQRTEKNMCT